MISEIKTQLEAAGFPVAYDHFPASEPKTPPFVCFLFTGTRPMAADGEVYYQSHQVRVELYAAFRDPVAEIRLEAALSGVVWEKSCAYIDDEQIYQTIYEFEV